jgi:hypothetical protein
LSETPEIVFGANTRHEGILMHFSDYEALEAPVRAAFTQPKGAKSLSLKFS